MRKFLFLSLLNNFFHRGTTNKLYAVRKEVEILCSGQCIFQLLYYWSQTQIAWMLNYKKQNSNQGRHSSGLLCLQ